MRWVGSGWNARKDREGGIMRFLCAYNTIPVVAGVLFFFNIID